ncbi:MAG: transcription-repair coupling factor [Clostridia bacterium]|nr:transcription-repair coupling factor [Clostridia bacterium]
MNLLTKQLTKNEQFKKVLESVKKSNDDLFKINGLNQSSKSFFTSALFEETKGNVCYILSNELDAKKKYDELKYLLGEDNVFMFPAKDIFFYSSDARSRELMISRMEVLNKIVSSRKTNNRIVVLMSSECLLDKISKEETLTDFSMHINKKSSFENLDEIADIFMFMGYEKVAEVSRQGEYATRGGIIDIFPIGYSNPIRVELWGDDVESIRYFDGETQRALQGEDIDEFTIMSVKDILFDKNKINDAKEYIVSERKKHENISNIYDKLYDDLELASCYYEPEKYINFMFKENELCSILDYFAKDDLIICDELRRIDQKCMIEEDLFYDYMKEELSKGKIVSTQTNIRFDFEDIKFKMKNYNIVTYSAFDDEGFIESKEQFYFNVKSIDNSLRNINVFKDEVERFLKEDYIPVILTSTKSELNNLKLELLNSNINVSEIDIDDDKQTLKEHIVYLSTGTFENGFVFENLNMVVFAADEIIKSKKQIKRKKKGKAIDSFTELKVGDYIVHDDYGIGIYEGIENITVGDICKDYLKITYADNAKLYVTIENLNLLQKYIGNDEKPPKINKLNGAEWVRAKAKAREGVREIADKLVKLYAERSSIKGHEFMQDNEWQKQFEDEFPFIETNDQIVAIDDVKLDMESDKVMDRLLCGDVGFGKTEVAIRAAFKAVQDGMQVVILAPTTILVEQHYKTFTERMKNYPVNIQYVSRFRTDKQVRESFEGARKGTVDILIGTHKLLSEKIEFKNLGLVVIDEEQRFGVEQKELLKERTKGVDTLSMSATPIPRTLHMSLSGIRDISILNEPPKERKPVQTYVIEKNASLIKNAIYKEVGRGGQVFYLFNKVKGIQKLTNELRTLMPDVHFEYAHGAMRKSEMEEVMREFVNGNIDVLVSTTIIETGIDIPNVNTMIIEDSDKMGLSQLYQLKGRVGRQSRSAYCYFMYNEGKSLTEVADKRLEALKEFTELGSGLKVAMRDLEIRGAGNLLGSEQHGHLAQIGYDMYCKLLEDEIARAKGLEIPKRYEMKIELKVNAYIDENYINDQMTKVDIYKRIASIETMNELEEMVDELTDRFGEVPSESANLLYIALLKSKAKFINVKSIIENDKFVTMTFYNQDEIKQDYINKLMEVVKDKEDKVRLSFGADTKLIYEKDKFENNKARLLLLNLIDLLSLVVEDDDKKENKKEEKQSKKIKEEKILVEEKNNTNNIEENKISTIKKTKGRGKLNF